MPLRHLLDDLRHGARILTRSPGLVATAALLMALVVGGSATSYALIDAVLRRPAPGVDATGLVSFEVDWLTFSFHDYSEYAAYATQTRTLRALAVTGVVGRPPVPVSSRDGTFLLQVTPVTGNYFDTIGVRPSTGRAFVPADDRAGAALVAVVSDRLWRRQFQQAGEIVGREITIDGKPATVIGIAPAGFGGPYWGTGYPDVWVPLGAYEGSRHDFSVQMIGRRRPGVSMPEVGAEFRAMQARMHAGSREEYRTVRVVPYAASAGTILSASKQQMLLFVAVLTGLSLVIVCANVANLLLARALATQRDMAVRQSVGASRARILGLQVGEGLAVAAVAWAVALAFAWSTTRLIPRVLPQGQLLANLPADFAPDWRVAAYAAGLTLVAAVLALLAPAVRAWRLGPLPLLSAGSHTTAQGRSRVTSTLVVVQFALSALLLTSAGLGYRSWSLRGIDIGFDTRHVLVAVVSTSAAARSAGEHAALIDRVRDRLTALPGVLAVSYTKGIPPYPWNRDTVQSGRASDRVQAQIDVVGAGFLEATGVRPLIGRDLLTSDRNRTGRVALINQRLARTLWPGASAVGLTFLMGDDRQPVEVVGVVPDAHYLGFSIEVPDTQPNYVLLADQARLGAGGREDAGAPGTIAWRIQYAGPLGSVASALPDALRGVEPRLAMAWAQTLEARLSDIASPSRMVTSLLFLFAGISLLIAAIGQYAVVAFSMRRRRRDFGIRLALGASERQLVRSVLGEAAWLTATGLAAGLALSAAAATLFRSVLFGIAPVDTPTYIAVAGILGVASFLACYLPAKDASRVNPIQALRQE